MTILTQANGPLRQMSAPSSVRAAGGNATARAHLGAVMRFCASVLVGVAAVTAVMALKAAYYLSHFSY